MWFKTTCNCLTSSIYMCTWENWYSLSFKNSGPWIHYTCRWGDHQWRKAAGDWIFFYVYQCVYCIYAYALYIYNRLLSNSGILVFCKNLMKKNFLSWPMEQNCKYTYITHIHVFAMIASLLAAIDSVNCCMKRGNSLSKFCLAIWKMHQEGLVLAAIITILIVMLLWRAATGIQLHSFRYDGRAIHRSWQRGGC